MLTDILGNELFEGDRVIISRSMRRSNSHLVYGTLTKIGAKSITVISHRGDRHVMQGGTLFKLSHDNVEAAFQTIEEGLKA